MEYSESVWRESAPKHVLMVSQWSCIREMKEAAALKERGWRVDSVSLRAPVMPEGFDICVTAQASRLRAYIESSGASIIHVHNEPDSLMREASAAGNGRPIVYDCHDLEYHRYGRVTDDERFAFDRADGIVNVGEAYRDMAYDLHPWSVPEVVVMSLPLRSWQPDVSRPRDFAVVYEGGVSDVSWRDFRKVDDALAAAGIPFSLYTSVVSKHAEGYRDVRGLLDYKPLLDAVSRFEFGFLGMHEFEQKWSVGLPNKLWEYACCGTIPVICNAAESARVFGGGIVGTSMPEVIEQMKSCDLAALRKDTLSRARYMDDEIQAVVDLYATLGVS